MKRATIILVAVFAVFICILLGRQIAVIGDATLGWDMASHGEKGVAVAQDIENLDVGRLYSDVIAQEHYPPVHSLISAVFYIIFGPTWQVGAAVSTVAFFFLVIMLTLCAWEISETGSRAVSSFTITFLVVTSLLFLVYADLIMLEILGALATVVCFFCYFKVLDCYSAYSSGGLFLGEREGLDFSGNGGGERWLWLTGFSSTLLMITASNYGLFWLVVLVLFEFVMLSSEVRRRTLFSIFRYIFSRRLFEPLNIVILALLCVLVWVRQTGGFKGEIFGRHISVTSTGAVLGVALLVAALKVGIYLWRNRRRLAESVPAKYKVFFWSVIVPLFLWFFVLYPPRFKQFFSWLEGHPAKDSYLSEDFLLFYPKKFLTDFSITPAIGIVVVAAFLLSLVLFMRKSRKVQFIQFYFLVTFTLCMLHRGRDPRYILPIIPALWLVAAEEIGGIISIVARRVRFIGRLVGIAFVLVVVILLIPDIKRLYSEDLPKAVDNFYYQDLAEPTNYVVDRIVNRKNVLVIGAFNGLSHHVIGWKIRQVKDIRDMNLNFDIRLPRKKDSKDELFKKWLEKGGEDTVVIIEREEESPYRYQEEEEGMPYLPSEFREFIEGQKTYILDSKRYFGDARIWVDVYVKE